MSKLKPLLAALSLVTMTIGNANPGRSQVVSTVGVNTPSIAGISLTPYNSRTHSDFARYLHGLPVQAQSLAPFAVILENHSGKDVVSLTLRWTWIDRSGRQHENDFWIDGLFLVHRPVVANGDVLLVTPSFLLAKSLLTSGTILPASRASLAQQAAQLSGSSQLALTVDSVIFADGLVLGPDQSNTLVKIRARRQAATQLSNTVLRMLQEGQDPSAMINHAADQPPVGPDFVAAYTANLAMLFQHGGDLRATAKTLATLPDLPFHRPSETH
jgi:hypothetical protein